MLFDAPDMQAIADATGLEIQTVSGFTRTGGEPIGSNQAAIDAVFDARILFDGEISEVIELDANRSAVFKVTQYNEASRRPLEDVREEIALSDMERPHSEFDCVKMAVNLLDIIQTGIYYVAWKLIL